MELLVLLVPRGAQLHPPLSIIPLLLDSQELPSDQMSETKGLPPTGKPSAEPGGGARMCVRGTEGVGEGGGGGVLTSSGRAQPAKETLIHSYCCLVFHIEHPYRVQSTVLKYPYTEHPTGFKVQYLIFIPTGSYN